MDSKKNPQLPFKKLSTIFIENMSIILHDANIFHSECILKLVIFFPGEKVPDRPSLHWGCAYASTFVS